MGFRWGAPKKVEASILHKNGQITLLVVVYEAVMNNVRVVKGKDFNAVNDSFRKTCEAFKP